MKSKFSIALTNEHAALLARRDRNRSRAVTVCLDRYFALLIYGWREVAASLTEAELELTLRLLQEVRFFDPLAVQMLPSEIADRLYARLADGPVGLDVAVLVGKLRRLSYGELLALVDVAECQGVAAP